MYEDVLHVFVPTVSLMSEISTRLIGGVFKEGIVTALSEMMRDLFTDLLFNTSDGMIREHQELAMMIDPLPGETPGKFDIPFTVLPFEFSSRELEGTAISLAPVGADCGLSRVEGRLDVRGQILFRELPAGTYQVCLE